MFTIKNNEKRKKESSLILRKAKFQAIFEFVLPLASKGTEGIKYNRISAFVSMLVLLIRRSREKFFKKNFRDDSSFCFGFAKVKALSFLRLRGASGAQGISAPASCHEAHKRRFLLNQWLLHFVCTSLRMTIPVLAFIFTLATTSESSAGTWDCGEIENTVSCSLGGNGVFIISGTGKMKDYQYNDDTPWNSKNIQTVVVGTGVTSIGERAFYGATGLTSITIPDSVKSIGDLAFYKAKSLTSITIPDSVTSIGYAAFDHAENLTSITLPKGITSISDDTFNGASSLTSITIPEGVTSIGDDAFAESGLESITIPNSVTSIGNGAFDGASSLKSITIPDSVTSIGRFAFAGASSLTSITIPDSVTYVGGDAFYGVKEIIISDKLDMSGWDSDALVDDGDGTVTFKCKGNQEICKEKIAEFAARAIFISGNNIIFDAGDHRECFRTSKDEENVSYYHTGTECAKLPESGNITCASGYADYNGNCYAQLPFSKKRWTPAEASQWLHDGNDNFVVITFKK